MSKINPNAIAFLLFCGAIGYAAGKEIGLAIGIAIATGISFAASFYNRK